MSCVVELLRSRLWPRAAALALMTIGVAACSGEVVAIQRQSVRLPRQSRNDRRRSRRRKPRPSAGWRARPLPPQTAQAAPPQSRARRRRARRGIAGGGRGMASYTPTSTRPGPPSSPRPAQRLRPRSPDRCSGAQACADRPLELGRRHPHHRRAGRHRRHHRAPLWRAGLRHHPGQQPHRAGDHPSRPATGHPALQPIADFAAAPHRRRAPHTSAAASSLRGTSRPPPAASPVGNPGVHVVAPARR